MKRQRDDRVGCLLVTGVIVTLGASASALAQGFDWGGTCDPGSGSFRQRITRRNDVVVGEIPARKTNVRITLRSQADVDIRLVDRAAGRAIIAWPDGDLSGPGPACTIYEAVRYCYSGYNGEGSRPGYEWISVDGTTNRPLVVSAFGYQAGMATVHYSYEAPPGCRDSGSGRFSQWVPGGDSTRVGDIPIGKDNVRVALQARQSQDLDIQLFDGDVKIIAWDPDGNHGLLNGPTEESVQYAGMWITYSGYNGRDNDAGREDITVRGTVTRTLTMKVYGYEEGDADVTYAWGRATPASTNTAGGDDPPPDDQW